MSAGSEPCADRMRLFEARSGDVDTSAGSCFMDISVVIKQGSWQGSRVWSCAEFHSLATKGTGVVGGLLVIRG